jgi:hypothetical protein
MRLHPRNTTADLHVPIPVPNIVTTSSDRKIDTGIQAEVPRQDGFFIEPGLFQVSFIFFYTKKKILFISINHSHFCVMLLV